jgi:trans-aconitate methyltransferase
MTPRIAGQLFGEVAEEFDRVRMSYPAELIEDVVEYGGHSRALEVGAGTGKATCQFVQRGLCIVAVEPDQAMAEVLARNITGVEIAHSTFEDFPLTERFNLLFSADAWHWTQPQTRWQKAAEALAAGGVLALFWNHERIAGKDQRHAVLDVYATHAPAIVVNDDPVPEHELFNVWPGNELMARDEFIDHQGRVYTSTRTVPGADYVTHVSTRSQVRMLDEATRQRMLAALADTLGDSVPLDVSTVLYLARRRRG